MKLVDIDKGNEGTFFRCLHDEKPADPRVMAMRREWYDKNIENGLRAKLLYDDNDVIVGLCQYIPIEYSLLVGKDLMAIQCMWVHGYDHLVGNQQKKGYGRFMLEQIEADAIESGFSGIAAWGMDFPYWNPVSFYEHMGYIRVEVNSPVVLVWKQFEPSAQPPALLKQEKQLPEGIDKVNLVAFRNGWCNGCNSAFTCRDAIAGIEHMVNYSEIDTTDKAVKEKFGVDIQVYLDGSAYRPFEPPWTAETLKQNIIELYHQKKIDD